MFLKGTSSECGKWSWDEHRHTNGRISGNLCYTWLNNVPISSDIKFCLSSCLCFLPALHNPWSRLLAWRPAVLRTRRGPTWWLDCANQEGVVRLAPHRHTPAGPGCAAAGQPREKHWETLPEGAAVESSWSDAACSSHPYTWGGATNGRHQVSRTAWVHKGDNTCFCFILRPFIIFVCSSLESEITSRLRTWRQALDRCRSAPQLCLCLLQLEKAIAWERSVTKVVRCLTTWDIYMFV